MSPHPPQYPNFLQSCFYRICALFWKGEIEWSILKPISQLKRQVILAFCPKKKKKKRRVASYKQMPSLHNFRLQGIYNNTVLRFWTYLIRSEEINLSFDPIEPTSNFLPAPKNMKQVGVHPKTRISNQNSVNEIPVGWLWPQARPKSPWTISVYHSSWSHPWVTLAIGNYGLFAQLRQTT